MATVAVTVVTMINVNELKRNAKNIVKKYSEAQVKVREATSNDPWGPSSTIMAEIADMTYNVVAFSDIMQMIWKRLNDHGKNWRHVFKSLVLLEYLIKTGTDKVAQQCIENIFAIQTLKDFQYVEDGKDHGSTIREKSKRMVALLKDQERLKAERARALKAKSRLVEAVSSSGKSSFGSSISRGSNGSSDVVNSSINSSGLLDNNNQPFVEPDSSSALRSDIDSARPHTLTEEETQLQIALALSKKEAEQQEKTRKNDELRLKLALDASKQQTAGGNDFMNDFPGPSTAVKSEPQQLHQQPASKLSKQSNIDDLLGLSFTPTDSNTSSQQQITSSTPTWPSATATSSTTTAPRLEPLNDPWSVDPWQATAMTAQALVPAPAPLKMMSKNPFED